MRVRDVIRHALRTDRRFNSGWEGIQLAQRIADACDGGDPPPGASVRVDEGDWLKLCEALREPQPIGSFTPYLVAPAHACAPLLRLVFEAQAEKA
jgi:hypothetical protein